MIKFLLKLLNIIISLLKKEGNKKVEEEEDMRIFSSDLMYNSGSEQDSNTITITFHENIKNLKNITIAGTQYDPTSIASTTMQLEKGTSFSAHSQGAIGLMQSGYKLVITLNNTVWSSPYGQMTPTIAAASVTGTLNESGTLSCTVSK